MLDRTLSDDLSDPHPALAALREESPVARVRTPDGPPVWVVTRYADVRELLRDDTRLSVDPAHGTAGDWTGFDLPAALREHLLAVDAEQHARLRRLISSPLTGLGLHRSVAAVEAEADRVVAGLDPDRRVDLVAELAVPLALAAVRAVLPLPGSAHEAFGQWVHETIGAPRRLDDAEPVRARDTLGRMAEIIATATTERGRGLLAELQDAHRSGRLSADELAAQVFYVLFVPTEPTVDALGVVLLRLLADAEHRAALRDSPEARQVAVAEALRHDSPQGFAAPRFARTDFDVAGTRIRAGQTVLPSLAAANRDPRQFADADRLDLTRNPNPHLAFGRGEHVCPATALSYRLLAAGVAALLRRYPGTALVGEVRWSGSFRHRGPARVWADLAA
ncbi:cytochrome P450 [Saccharopolyspora rosea]|uniref:Cytochrome P450 n=1 Tax=Saccharopolyspora rosea TaxID=524884 RepID=A0ABW3FZJ1_9PSEU